MMSVNCSPVRCAERSACSMRSSSRTRFGSPVSGSRSACERAARRRRSRRDDRRSRRRSRRDEQRPSTRLGGSARSDDASGACDEHERGEGQCPRKRPAQMPPDLGSSPRPRRTCPAPWRRRRTPTVIRRRRASAPGWRDGRPSNEGTRRARESAHEADFARSASTGWGMPERVREKDRASAGESGWRGRRRGPRRAPPRARRRAARRPARDATPPVDAPPPSRACPSRAGLPLVAAAHRAARRSVRARVRLHARGGHRAASSASSSSSSRAPTSSTG